MNEKEKEGCQSTSRTHTVLYSIIRLEMNYSMDCYWQGQPMWEPYRWSPYLRIYYVCVVYHIYICGGWDKNTLQKLDHVHMFQLFGLISAPLKGSFEMRF